MKNAKSKFVARKWSRGCTIVASALFTSPACAQDSIPVYFKVDNTLLVSLLLLLCGWLAYRLMRSRLEILNIQAIDFHALADNAHDGIFIVQDERLVYANQRACDILSYDSASLLGKKLKNIIHPDEAEEVVDIHLRRIRGEEVSQQYEATFLNSHNSKVPVELSAAITSWHGKTAALVIIRDITERKLIEKTLMDSEKRYRSLVENSPDAILIIDVQSNSIIEANEQTEQLFKLTKSQLFATQPDELGHILGNTQQKPFRHYLDRALHGLPLIFERHFHNSDGDTISCEIRLSRMPFPNRKLVRASIIDVTQRKLYQHALSKSEERLVSFFQASCEVLFFHDEGTITDVNDVVEKMFGYSRSELIGHHVLEYVAEESQSLARQYLAQYTEGPYELIAVRKDGSRFPVQIQAKTLQQDTKAMRVVSVNDISNLKHTSERLQSSELNLQNIVETMLDIYYRTDTNGTITMASPSAEDLLGYRPEELIGANILTLYADPYSRQFFLDTLAANNGIVRNFETALRHKNGDILWVSTNARYRCDPQGNIEGVEGITRDITSQRNFHLALSQAKNELELKVDRRTRQLELKIAELERLQKNLAESEEKFRTLVDNAVDTFMLHDAQGHIIDVNRQACISLGYSREELLALNIEDIDVGPAPVSFKEIISSLSSAQQKSFQVEGIHRRKDGRCFPVEVNLGLLEKANQTLILALARDISHRHDAHREQTISTTVNLT